MPTEKIRVPGARERVALRLTRKPKVRTAIGSNPALDSFVAVRNSSPGRPEPCEGNLVAAEGSCVGLMVKHPWPLLEISLSDFRRLAQLNINTYLPTYLLSKFVSSQTKNTASVVNVNERRTTHNDT